MSWGGTKTCKYPLTLWANEERLKLLKSVQGGWVTT